MYVICGMYMNPVSQNILFSHCTRQQRLLALERSELISSFKEQFGNNCQESLRHSNPLSRFWKSIKNLTLNVEKALLTSHHGPIHNRKGNETTQNSTMGEIQQFQSKFTLQGHF